MRFDGRGAEGTFDQLKGTIQFNPAQLNAARMDVFVETAAINTGNSLQDSHARGKKWFDAETYPRISFVSKSFRQTNTGYQVVGDLTMKGKTKEVSIPFTFKDNTFEGNFTVSRDAYGIEGPFFSFTVGDDFEVSLKVPVERVD